MSGGPGYVLASVVIGGKIVVGFQCKPATANQTMVKVDVSRFCTYDLFVAAQVRHLFQVEDMSWGMDSGRIFETYVEVGSRKL